ncbi:uncharacterized protein [Nicotiana sylvestris]|uniref:uncharacterized protein n=1 Tax=Nicotiana sylvestris TaxID=4096 RepID=UPI00388C76A2
MPFKQKEMTLFLKKYRVEVTGIAETRVKVNKARRITQKIAKDWQVKYNYDHAYNGRIWLLWKPHIKLQILESTGWYYIWCNKRDDNARVYSKIDLAFGNYNWLMNYGHIEAEYLNPGVSDHSPNLLKCNCIVQQQNLHPRPFKLYQAVLHHPDFAGILKKVWAQDYKDIGMSRTWQKLKRLKEALRELNTYMTSYQQKLNQAKQELELAQYNISLQPLCQIYIEQEKEALIEVEKWSNVEEQVLRQKSRATWIQYRDVNTKYFHAQWKMRISANTINSIHNDAGIKIIEPK